MSDYKPNYNLPHVMTPENTNAEVIDQMRSHVNSYLTLSRHNHNCLVLCERLEAAERRSAYLNATNETQSGMLSDYHIKTEELESQLDGLRTTRTHLQKDVKELKAKLAEIAELPTKARGVAMGDGAYKSGWLDACSWFKQSILNREKGE